MRWLRTTSRRILPARLLPAAGQPSADSRGSRGRPSALPRSPAWVDVLLEKVEALRLRAAARSGGLFFACCAPKEIDIFDLLMLLSAVDSLGRTSNAELTSSQAFATPWYTTPAVRGTHAAVSTTCAENLHKIIMWCG
ncbi:hypothetical protein PSPO01_02170 [Paraphaeosphaeria sporulosa]